MYLPIKVGTTMGMISFLNETYGEIWHNLILNCLPSDVIKLNNMQCELGKITT